MAIITAAQAREKIPGLNGTDEDTTLDGLIAAADAVIAAELGYDAPSEGGNPTIEDTTYTEYLEGPGGRVLRLRHYPIVSITSIEDDIDEEFDGSSELVASSDYAIRDMGRVLLTTTSTHGVWTESDNEVIKAIYVAGYQTIPEALQEVAKLLVAQWFKEPASLGRSAINVQGSSVTPRTERWPKGAERMLEPYRLHWSVFP